MREVILFSVFWICAVLGSISALSLVLGLLSWCLATTMLSLHRQSFPGHPRVRAAEDSALEAKSKFERQWLSILIQFLGCAAVVALIFRKVGIPTL